MSYAQQIGETLADTLNELFAIDDLNIPLNEIRDLSTLQGHMKNVEAKYGTKHAKYKALQNLHAKKEAAEARKAERQAKIKSRQEFHAKRFGYAPVKGTKRGQWVHKDTGHTLSFGGDRSWSHMKSGAKRAKGGNATPIRDLRNHLSKLHEGAELTGEELNEIRSLEKLRMQANQALLNRDPRAQQRLMRALELQKRKRSLMGEAEDEHNDHTKTQFHKTLADHGLVHVDTKHFKNNGSFHEDKTPDTTAHTYEHPKKKGEWRAQVTIPHGNDNRRPHCYYKDGKGDVTACFTNEHLRDKMKK
jgi:hypothetical protein